MEAVLSKVGSIFVNFGNNLESFAVAIVDTQWLIILLALLGITWGLKDKWGAPCYHMFGAMKLPDPRDMTCCCISCGWLIMNVWCPFVCPKFHPPHALRMIILKATRLNFDELAPDNPEVYVQVAAGGNPVKTTSCQKCEGSNKGKTDAEVLWNEPMDVLMNPSDTQIHFDLFHRDGRSETNLGTLTLPVDAIYEPPGACPDCPCFGKYNCPQFCQKTFKTAYRWPFVRGAPTWKDVKRESRLRNRSDLCCCCYCDEYWPEKDEVHHAPSQNAMLTGNGSRNEVLKTVLADGMKLGSVSQEYRNDRDVVLAAVKQNPGAIQFASEALQSDVQVRRIASSVPKPLLLRVRNRKNGKESCRLWAYFIFHNQDEELNHEALLQP
eukprot:TRINITY_DN19400_c0_g1_i1.p1 TRINITY_DN19400_c0_g1~~TRINITY_DN19400_c0_g1_i1.p1  ORF type:complete len:402 (-),score=40.76 TRINITY_DN19400_c0_g1_i1:109-1251(-)